MSIIDKIIKKEDEKEALKKKVAAAKSKAAKKVKEPKKERVKSNVTPVHYFEIIKRPYISEKAFTLNSVSQYVFLVSDNSNKSEVKKAIEKAYKVKVAGVNITNTKAKPKRYRGFENKRSGFKKAIVTLKKGSTIDVMETAK